MSRPAPEALRRGWCPGALRPMETGDGWLVRVSPRPGLLAPSALRLLADLAERHGNGLVEISARGNLQLRGVTSESHKPLVEALIESGLVQPDEPPGPQRLTLTAPLAGHDPADLLDAAALAGAIEARCRSLNGLPPKCAVAVDGGGRLSLDGFAVDLRLRALSADALALGLPDGRWLGPLPPARAPDAVATALERFIAQRRRAPGTVRRLRDLPRAAMDSLAATLGLPFIPAPPRRPAPDAVGVFDTGATRAVLAAPPFGRCDAAMLLACAEAAAAAGAADVRLSPWRAVAILDLSPEAAQGLARRLAAAGFILAPDDPRLFVTACPGRPACGRGEVATVADAARLVHEQPGLPGPGRSIHLSGCVKSCARPGPAALTLVGSGGLYDVVIAGGTRDAAVARLDFSALMRRLAAGGDLRARLEATRDPA